MIINKNNIEAFISQIRDIVQQNAFAIVDISESNINRSTAQNAYVFGVLYTQLHKHFLNMGFSMEIEEIHNFCKNKFCLDQVAKVQQTGSDIKISISTKKMNRQRFNAYIFQVESLISEFENIYK